MFLAQQRPFTFQTNSKMKTSTALQPVSTTDSMFRAFSDRTRLRILHVLQGGELCVGDIVEILQAPQPRISRHLAYLRKAKLVAVRKVGPMEPLSPCPGEDAVPQKAAGMSRQVLQRSAGTASRHRAGRQAPKIRRLLSREQTLHKRRREAST